MCTENAGCIHERDNRNSWEVCNKLVSVRVEARTDGLRRSHRTKEVKKKSRTATKFWTLPSLK